MISQGHRYGVLIIVAISVITIKEGGDVVVVVVVVMVMVMVMVIVIVVVVVACVGRIRGSEQFDSCGDRRMVIEAFGGVLEER